MWALKKWCVTKVAHCKLIFSSVIFRLKIEFKRLLATELRKFLSSNIVDRNVSVLFNILAYIMSRTLNIILKERGNLANWDTWL